MITADKVEVIGKINKAHGVRGEMSVTMDSDIDPAELRCVLLRIDGLFVPFFIDSIRPRSSSAWLLTFSGIDSQQKASRLTGMDVYALSDELPEADAEADATDGAYLYDLEGYTVADSESGKAVGEIVGIDDSTANILLHVETPEGSIVYLPLAEDLIDGIDNSTATINMMLPPGILDLN